jgi:hypothetical protein
MYFIVYTLFVFVTIFATPNLFDHATKSYTDYLKAQSVEKALTAPTIVKAVNIIKEVEQETDKNGGKDSNEVECDEKTFDELRLICAKNGSPFLEKINPKTAIGFAHLIKLLTKPTSNTEELKKRQSIITFFIEHPDIIEKIQHLLIDLKKEEDSLLLPYKKYTILKTLEHYGSFFFTGSLSIVSLIALIIMGGFEHTVRVKAITEYYAKLNLPSHLCTSMIDFFTFQNIEFTRSITDKNVSPKCRFYLGLLMGGPLISLGLLVYDYVKAIFTVKDFILNNSLMHHTSELFTVSCRINNQKNFFKIPEILKKIEPSLPYKYCSLTGNRPSLTTVSNLNCDNLALYSERIPLLNRFSLEKKISNDLHPHTYFLKRLYYDMGLLDAYSSLAQFYKDQQCHFAHYIENKTPILEISGGLHPNGLNYPNLIGNNFSYELSSSKNPIIISGKNGSGKSFNTKMLILTAWMAQTIGFTLTEKPCIITPFDYFKIHANISDSDYFSKFETEKNEIAQLLEKAFTLEKENKKGFIIFDEPLSTTSSVLAEPILNALVKIIQKNNGFLTLIITHLHSLLAHKKARQMSIAVTSNGDGTFTSTRKFQEGPSFDNDAAQLLAQALNPKLRDMFLKTYRSNIAKARSKSSNSDSKEDKEPTENKSCNEQSIVQ